MRIRLFALFSALLALLLVAPTFAAASEANLVIDPAAAPAGDPFKSCEEIVSNPTTKTQIVMVRICNGDDSFEMNVDVSGTKLKSIPGGECRTFFVELKPGEFLHADRDGKITYPRATADSLVRQ